MGYTTGLLVSEKVLCSANGKGLLVWALSIGEVLLASGMHCTELCVAALNCTLSISKLDVLNWAAI